MKILLTGFDPFGGESINPAWEVAKRVRSQEGVEIISLMVPTIFNLSIKTVVKAMELHKPDVVVCLGQAGGRSDITPERLAVNINDASIPDNAGVVLTDEPIIKEGDNAYFSTLPVKAIVEAIKGAGIPSSLSNSAGTYVCNHLMYGVLHTIKTHYPEMLGGFIHIPYIPSQAVGKSSASMNLSDIIKGIEIAIDVIVTKSSD